MSRFATVDNVELERIMNEKSSINTHRATNLAWNTLMSYLKEKDLFNDFDPNTILKEQLNHILKMFYVEVRKSDGSLYHKNMFTSLRFGLQRKFKNIRKDIDIVEDSIFSESNIIFKAQTVQLKKNGLVKTITRNPFLRRILRNCIQVSVFGLSNPQALQKKSIFRSHDISLSSWSRKLKKFNEKQLCG